MPALLSWAVRQQSLSSVCLGGYAGSQGVLDTKVLVYKVRGV